MKNVFVLVFFLLPFNSAVAQSSTSGQPMDIRGKIKISDDFSAPTGGTMRYTSGGGFEGYTTNGWQSLTAAPVTFFPGNAIPVFANDDYFQPGYQDSLVFNDWNGNAYSPIPAKKMIVVTGIYPKSYNATGNESYIMQFTVYMSGGSALLNTVLKISGYDNQQEYLTGDAGPLMVIKPGQVLQTFNYGNSPNMSVAIRGFLVDDPSAL